MLTVVNLLNLLMSPSFRQALSPEQAEYCMRRMKPYRDSTGNIIRGAFDYKEFAQSLFWFIYIYIWCSFSSLYNRSLYNRPFYNIQLILLLLATFQICCMHYTNLSNVRYTRVHFGIINNSNKIIQQVTFVVSIYTGERSISWIPRLWRHELLEPSAREVCQLM